MRELHAQGIRGDCKRTKCDAKNYSVQLPEDHPADSLQPDENAKAKQSSRLRGIETRPERNGAEKLGQLTKLHVRSKGHQHGCCRKNADCALSEISQHRGRRKSKKPHGRADLHRTAVLLKSALRADGDRFNRSQKYQYARNA